MRCHCIKLDDCGRILLLHRENFSVLAKNDPPMLA
jgi:hypothetical protein